MIAVTIGGNATMAYLAWLLNRAASVLEHHARERVEPQKPAGWRPGHAEATLRQRTQEVPTLAAC